MATIPQIRDRLREVFTEQQADVLAHVVIEAHDNLVSRADFHELTGVVRELAEAQKGTEIRVEELADAQKRTEIRLEELADAQKRTEIRVEELADAQKRTEIRVEELADAQKRTEIRVEELADAQKRTEIRVEELADAQKRTEIRVEELADAQKRTEIRVEELAEAQKAMTAQVGDLTDAQRQTEVTILDLVRSQHKMLIRLDRTDGRTLELLLTRHLPAYVGREYRRCRVIETAELVDSLEGRLPEADLDDLARADVIATARDGERQVHLVVEVSCTADTDDIERAARRAATLARAGLAAIGIVACEAMDPRAVVTAEQAGVRVLLDGRFVSNAA